MSSSPLLVLMALTSFLVLPGGSLQISKTGSVAELLLRDEVVLAEALLDQLPKSAENTALRGEIEYRKGNFERAQGHYNEALKMDDNTGRGYFGLGKLAMAKLKPKEAIKNLLRAIELEPAEPIYRLYASEAWGIEKNHSQQKKQLQEYIRLNPTHDPDRLAEAKAGLEMLEAFGRDTIGAVEAPASPSPIRFRKSLNLIFASVMVDGQGPFDFAIDTGASQTVLSEKLASQLGLKPITTTIMHGVGGVGRVETKVYRMGEIRIGDVKIRNLPVGTFNDPLVTQIADGIIGTAALADYIITVNYPESQVELARKPPTTSSASDSIPTWYFSNLLLIPVELNGKHRGNFIVDTGAVTTVISHSIAAQLGVNEDTPGAKIDLGIAGVGGFEGVVLRVADVTFTTGQASESFTQVVSIDLKQISKMIGTEVAGVVGTDFFDQYKLILDYYGAHIRLTK